MRRLILFTFLMCISFTAVSSAALISDDYTKGLYHCDELSTGRAGWSTNSIADSSGTGNPLQLMDTLGTAAPVLSADGEGASGQTGDKALVFSGGNAAIVAGLYNTEMTSLRVEFSFQINSYDSTGESGSDWYATLFEASNLFRLRATTAGANAGQLFILQVGNSNNYETSAAYDMDPDNWNHVVATWDGTEMSLTVNGTTVTMATEALPVTFQHGYFGACSSDVTRFQFSGTMDEIKYGLVPEPASIALFISAACLTIFRKKQHS